MTDTAPPGSCAQHADSPADATCEVCGVGLCVECRKAHEQETLCDRCFEAREPAPGAEGADQVEGLSGGDEGADAAAGGAGGEADPGPGPDTPETETTAAPETETTAADELDDGSGAADADPGDAAVAAIDGAPTAPARTSSRTRLELPLALYVLLLFQVIATLLVAYALLRDPIGLFGWLRPAAEATAELALPTIELAEDLLDAGGAVTVGGRAAGDTVVLVVDGVVVAAMPTARGRYRFNLVDLDPGRHALTVVTYRRDGASATSVPLELELPGFVTPTPAAGEVIARPSPRPRGKEVARVKERRAPAPRPTARDRSSATLPRPTNILRGRRERHMALTFDGGSNASQANAVLDTLAARGVRSTLFLTGEFIAKYPAITRRIVDDGHEVGNHTLDHPHLADWVDGAGHITRPGVDREFLRAQLSETRRRFERITGAKMARYWRAPYGEVNRQILRWAAGEGYVHVGWTAGLDTLDWVSDPNDKLYRSPREIRDRLIAKARDDERTRGGIVLMHLGAERASDEAAAVELPQIIDGLRREGYELVTVTRLLGS